MSENNYIEKNRKVALVRYKKSVKKKQVLNRYVKSINIHNAAVNYNVGEVTTYKEEDNFQKEKELEAAKVYKNPAVCSCCMCGNPRRIGWSDTLTLKELSYNDRKHPDNSQFKE